MRATARVLFTAAVAVLFAGGLRAAERPDAPVRPDVPAYRVETDGFGAAEADIRAVLDSAARELWRFFPDREIEPIVVERGRRGPITLYRRNPQGEIVMRLDTESTYWCQYVYQFAHELCHVLCGLSEATEGPNKWFEETLCETASLFVLRAMARSWKDAPPYAHWANYRDALRSYADDVIRRRDALEEVHARGMAAFYQAHRERLEEEACDRDFNGAMAVVLLHWFEREPERWEAIGWLNHAASSAPRGESFEAYLRRWHDAAPERHREFIRRIAALYGFEEAAP
jgi:hypothetical protein